MPSRFASLVRPAAVTAATAAWVISALVNNLQGPALVASLAGGALLTVAAVGLPMLAERRAVARADSAEQIAEDASARMQLVVDDALEPLVYLIGRITDQRRRALGRDHTLQVLQGQATVVVLGGVQSLAGTVAIAYIYLAVD